MPLDGIDTALNEPVALRRVRLVVAYDGRGFRGFAINHQVRTVMGVLTDALSTITRHPVELAGAGRTDAGVHGWGQVVSGDIPADADLTGVVRRANAMCGPEVVVRSAEWAGDTFHARFSALWRHYRYTVLNAAQPNPFLEATAWRMHRPLSLPAMQLACDPLIGEQDFTSFCRVPDRDPDQPPPSMHR
ncbi:MAG TPA: tRNA pseudouridine synthase A, partial [Ilumatobacteraceae bacterium]|nr:tRNA pseudouridine synthase A [Ilumatobacteraceae bacterium]